MYTHYHIWKTNYMRDTGMTFSLPISVTAKMSFVSGILQSVWLMTYGIRNEKVILIRKVGELLKPAAKLIKNSIRKTIFDTEFYPAENQIKDKRAMSEWVPDLLLTFLKKMICDENKQIALGHCIVQASRPKSVLSPILLGVGISIDHKVGGTGILQFLSRLGLSVTPDEVVRYKQSLVQIEDDSLPASGPDYFTQWSGDNVDHNVATVDGLGTFSRYGYDLHDNKNEHAKQAWLASHGLQAWLTLRCCMQQLLWRTMRQQWTIDNFSGRWYRCPGRGLKYTMTRTQHMKYTMTKRQHLDMMKIQFILTMKHGWMKKLWKLRHISTSD